MRLVSSERLVPSRGTSASREVIQCREYIDVARAVSNSRSRCTMARVEQDSGSTRPGTRARSDSAGGGRSGALGDVTVGPRAWIGRD